ncbi:hypothetical protein [Azorhizobium sp. AG788]|uniref:hypothetical protein n=1 Tax=Azorhizobium sp. AG788 TaxID=2183897 RepID=UPI003138DDD3
MRNLSYAALALAAGLALSGAAQADEYISASNRENYAVAAASAASEHALLPLSAQATAATRHQPAQPAQPTFRVPGVVGPFDNGDAHSGPAHSGSPALW